MGGRLRAVSWSIAVIGLVVVGAGCQTALPPPYFFKADTPAVYLVAEQSGAASFRLPADPTAPAVPDTGGNYYDTKQALTTGLTNALGRLQGQANPAPYSFKALADQTRWLDLDENVTGTVYISNSLSAAAPRALEMGVIRVTLRVNGALAGGMDFPLAAAAAASVATWVPIHYSFPPEVSVLRAGDLVALEVTQLSGLADLRIGTGGNHQSHARIHFYPFDPLSGLEVLSKHKLVIRNPEGNVSPGTFMALAERAIQGEDFEALPPGTYFLDQPAVADATGAGAGLGAIMLAPLAWSSARGMGRSRGRAVLAAALIVAVALAGCSDGKSKAPQDNSDLPPDARPAVDQEVHDIADAGEGSAVGELAGVVRDWRNLTMKGAYVAVLGTSMFTETDEAGRFAFLNVTAGNFVLRVDAPEMRSIEENVEVQANKRTVVTVKMAPLDPTVPDKFAHVHDEWRGGNSVILLDTKFTPDASKGYLIDQPSAGAPICVPWTATGVDGRAADDLCFWPVKLPLDVKVPPGAGAIDVTIDWTGDATEMGVRAYQPATRKAIDGTHVARGKGQVTHITFFPHEADPGHQPFSNWVLDIFIPASDPTTFGQQPIIDVGQISIKAVAFRTVVPFEPGHPDLWDGKDRLRLFEGAQDTFGTTNQGLPHPDTVFVPPRPLFVPADADRIEGTFEISRGNAGETALLQTLGLAYKPASVPSGRWSEGLEPIALQGTFPKYTFSFPVDPADADQPYQTASNFFFYPTSDSDYSYRGTLTFTLHATVFKKS